jgi:hypothetical protein
VSVMVVESRVGLGNFCRCLVGCDYSEPQVVRSGCWMLLVSHSHDSQIFGVCGCEVKWAGRTGFKSGGPRIGLGIRISEAGSEWATEFVKAQIYYNSFKEFRRNYFPSAKLRIS